MAVLSFALAAAVALAPIAALAQQGTARPEEVFSAIGRVHTEVPITARTAEVLGTERDGSGVVIDGSGDRR